MSTCRASRPPPRRCGRSRACPSNLGALDDRYPVDRGRMNFGFVSRRPPSPPPGPRRRHAQCLRDRLNLDPFADATASSAQTENASRAGNRDIPTTFRIRARPLMPMPPIPTKWTCAGGGGNPASMSSSIRTHSRPRQYGCPKLVTSVELVAEKVRSWRSPGEATRCRRLCRGPAARSTAISMRSTTTPLPTPGASISRPEGLVSPSRRAGRYRRGAVGDLSRQWSSSRQLLVRPAGDQVDAPARKRAQAGNRGCRGSGCGIVDELDAVDRRHDLHPIRYAAKSPQAAATCSSVAPRNRAPPPPQPHSGVGARHDSARVSGYSTWPSRSGIDESSTSAIDPHARPSNRARNRTRELRARSSAARSTSGSSALRTRDVAGAMMTSDRSLDLGVVIKILRTYRDGPRRYL